MPLNSTTVFMPTDMKRRPCIISNFDIPKNVDYTKQYFYSYFSQLEYQRTVLIQKLTVQFGSDVNIKKIADIVLGGELENWRIAVRDIEYEDNDGKFTVSYIYCSTPEFPLLKSPNEHSCSQFIVLISGMEETKVDLPMPMSKYGGMKSPLFISGENLFGVPMHQRGMLRCPLRSILLDLVHSLIFLIRDKANQGSRYADDGMPRPTHKPVNTELTDYLKVSPSSGSLGKLNEAEVIIFYAGQSGDPLDIFNSFLYYQIELDVKGADGAAKN